MGYRNRLTPKEKWILIFTAIIAVVSSLVVFSFIKNILL